MIEILIECEFETACKIIISDAQFGFRQSHSTSDTIFVLHSLINRTLPSRKRLYCCFVYYKRAFCSINRIKLVMNFLHVVIHGKLLIVVRFTYDEEFCQ